ncbi:hypothetical protein V1508DRAFT_190613 [Lipomyces doorenjongii]|uniref:uncharacterized protein n=1 Tax=Lipomyces doorenjongii TaxID=383834 RepID=UPI0034CFEAE5
MLADVFTKSCCYTLPRRRANILVCSTKIFCDTCKEPPLKWLRTLLKEIHQEQTKPTTVFEDSQGCNRLSKDPTMHRRIKCIDISYIFLREKVIEGVHVNIVWTQVRSFRAGVGNSNIRIREFW